MIIVIGASLRCDSSGVRAPGGSVDVDVDVDIVSDDWCA